MITDELCECMRVALTRRLNILPAKIIDQCMEWWPVLRCEVFRFGDCSNFITDLHSGDGRTSLGRAEGELSQGGGAQRALKRPIAGVPNQWGAPPKRGVERYQGGRNSFAQNKPTGTEQAQMSH
ncbi:hypothetical protein EVAR_92837_1 [Eumeta japonica]|uniref:Uncharacterized protein n=1 Tax=Eumeta variegata TaxID=151549 RepID=A0A4C1T9V3_EUMVA|nr:hypothetical protein EVAR_92837_1 [Eumeta japonica]